MADFDTRLHRGAAAPTSIPQQTSFLATRARLVQDSETFEQRFVAAVRQAFAQLGQSVRDAPMSSAEPTLSLLDSHAQELNSALDQLARRSELQSGQVLVELGFRLGVLVASPPLDGRTQPLSPRSILLAFHHAAAPLQLPAEQQLLLLQCFDQALMRQLLALHEALADPPSCTQPGHPAYRVLRKVVEVARDWLPGADGRDDRAVATQLGQALQRLSDEQPDAALCMQVHDQLVRQLALWCDKARVAERRHIEAMRGRERLERARRRSGELLAQRLAGTTASSPLRALFDDAWADVLALALLRQGESSSLFATLLVITDQLLGRIPGGDRARLQRDVENGLQQIGLYGSEATRMAHALIDAGHADETSAMRRSRRRHEPLLPPEPQPDDTPAGTLDPALEACRRSTLAHLREARFGSWFEFVDADGASTVQRRLAWFSALSGRCLFVTRRGQRAAEMDLDELARAIVNGRVRELRTEVDG